MMINTIHGDMDESLLEKRTGESDSETDHTTWVEYLLGGEVVHRSVSMELKEGAISQTLASVFN